MFCCPQRIPDEKSHRRLSLLLAAALLLALLPSINIIPSVIFTNVVFALLSGESRQSGLEITQLIKQCCRDAKVSGGESDEFGEIAKEQLQEKELKKEQMLNK